MKMGVYQSSVVFGAWKGCLADRLAGVRIVLTLASISFSSIAVAQPSPPSSPLPGLSPPTFAPVPPPGTLPPSGGFTPRIFAPLPGQGPQALPVNPTPAQPPLGNLRAPIGTSIRLQALARENGEAIGRGLVWRVYAPKPGSDGKVPLLTQSNEAQPLFRLPPGTYVVNVSYGRASLTKRVEVSTTPVTDTFVLNAGALRLQASSGDRIIPDSRVTYSLTAGAGPGGPVVVETARAGRILRLPAGEYFINSRYGEANAFMSGDVKIESGRLTEVTMKHRAAQITLKLVTRPGAEALANTAWTVLTPGGDTVQESIGAFPIMVLGAGDYAVIARNDGRIFNGRFTVDTGRDREVEILAKFEGPAN